MQIEKILQRNGYRHAPESINGIFCEICHKDSTLVGDDQAGYAVICPDCKIYARAPTIPHQGDN